MSDKQKISIVALPVLVVTMFAVYQMFASFLGRELAWYAGFWIYWLLWCIAFPALMLGWRSMSRLFGHGRLDAVTFLLMILPPAITLIGRFVMTYDQADAWGRVILVSMALANGILEEVLWRGIYITLFPDDLRWGVVWPTLWFGLWHLAPGSVSQLNPWVLAAGALVSGACLSVMAMRSGTIHWSVVSHTLAGLARVL